MQVHGHVRPRAGATVTIHAPGQRYNMHYTPEEARALAASINRAADEAETGSTATRDEAVARRMAERDNELRASVDIPERI
jgi:hypothetical protein